LAVPERIDSPESAQSGKNGDADLCALPPVDELPLGSPEWVERKVEIAQGLPLEAAQELEQRAETLRRWLKKQEGREEEARACAADACILAWRIARELPPSHRGKKPPAGATLGLSRRLRQAYLAIQRIETPAQLSAYLLTEAASGRYPSKAGLQRLGVKLRRASGKRQQVTEPELLRRRARAYRRRAEGMIASSPAGIRSEIGRAVLLDECSLLRELANTLELAAKDLEEGE